jgi:transcriptional regulator of acetoin/glycerol metabolism
MRLAIEERIASPISVPSGATIAVKQPPEIGPKLPQESLCRQPARRPIVDRRAEWFYGGNTGDKKLAAPTIHNESRRSSAAFIAVNCDAIASPRVRAVYLGVVSALWICCKASATFSESESETLPWPP